METTSTHRNKPRAKSARFGKIVSGAAFGLLLGAFAIGSAQAAHHDGDHGNGHGNPHNDSHGNGHNDNHGNGHNDNHGNGHNDSHGHGHDDKDHGHGHDK